MTKVEESMGHSSASRFHTLVCRSEIKFLQLSSCGMRSRIVRVKSWLVMRVVSRSQREAYWHCMSSRPCSAKIISDYNPDCTYNSIQKN
jgi:hypothetical protein